MKPIDTPECNFTYLGPTPDIGDLRVKRADREVTSYWKPSGDEIAYLVAGGLVKLGILIEPIPPVSLNVTEPYCEFEHRMTLVLNDRQEWHFKCETCGTWA